MANNNLYFNSALAGYLSGNLAGRRPPSSAAGAYTALLAAATAFATDIDTAIPFDPLVSQVGGAQLAPVTDAIAANTQLRGGLLQTLCEAATGGAYSEDAVIAGSDQNTAGIAAAFNALKVGLVTP